MIKRLVISFFALFLLIPVTGVLAGGFNLSSIGQVDTSGRQISHWWYSGSSATMKGQTISGNTVTVSIDGIEGTAIVDSDGNWTYTPASLADGDHEIILTSGGSTISFTLTTGATNVNWDMIGKDASVSALPTVGMAFPTIILMGMGVALVLVGKKLAKQN